MHKPHTWRELLGTIIDDPQERQRLAQALHLHPVTLSRWATGKANPRQEALRRLLHALPQVHSELRELLAREYPSLSLEETASSEQTLEIPSAFYRRVLATYTLTPPTIRYWSIGILILQQILAQLDPHHLGMVAALAQCLPPKEGMPVRSLYKTLGRATGPWSQAAEHQTELLGAESQVGQATMRMRPIVTQNREEMAQQFPVHQINYMESSVAFPILLYNQVAGCLCIATAQPHYFSRQRLELIQHYAELLVLAIEPDAFYAIERIKLAVIPASRIQQPLLARFHQRVTERLKQASQAYSILTLPQAERLVWQEIEEELLYASL